MKILKIIVNIVLFIVIVAVIHTIVSNIFFESRLEVREPAVSGKRSIELPPHAHSEATYEVAQRNVTYDEAQLSYMGALRGYNIIAKLEIPTINLTTDVLAEYSESALRISVTRFTGPSPNEIGNLVITGHNYIDSNMFSRLNRLRPGHKLYLTDASGRQIQYVIYDVYKVWPNDGSVLDQETHGIREITLITCTSDSRQRIIVNAMEVM